MPFTETDIVDERTRFIEDAHRSLHSFTWLCEQYGISRKTGYEWLDPSLPTYVRHGARKELE